LALSVLVVDDEPAVLETMAAILRSRKYRVMTAVDGLDALQVLENTLPDLILTDLTMPRMSGSELVSRVRERFPEMPIVVFSGQYIELPPEIPADAFLQKGGYLMRDLFKTLEGLMAKRGNGFKPQTGASAAANTD